MSENTTPPTRRDRIAKDADLISGFFGTRAGTITAVSLIGAIVVCAVLGWVLG